MHYELWDVSAGRGIARFRHEHEALALIRTLLDRYGDPYADDLELGIEKDEGALVERVTGRTLAVRARQPVSVGNT